MLELLRKLLSTNENLMAPSTRSGHCSVCVGPYIVIFGGYNNTNDVHQVYTELWFYHIYNKSWERHMLPEGFKVASLSSRMVFSNGVIYIYGGTGYPFANENIDSVYAFDLEKVQWSIIGSEDSVYKPEGKYGHSMIIYKDRLYIYGGTVRSLELNELNVFNLKTKSWIPIDPPVSGLEPPKLYRHEAVCHDSKMYVLGGGSSTLSAFQTLKCVWILDLKTHEWKKKKTYKKIGNNSYPPNRTNFAATYYDDHIYISGGVGSSSVVFKDIWKLSLKTYEWDKLDITLRFPLYFHSMVSFNDGTLYVFGGVRNDYVSRSNKLQTINHGVKKLVYLSAEKVLTDILNDSDNELIIENFSVRRIIDRMCQTLE